jgi:hypothetical protein
MRIPRRLRRNAAISFFLFTHFHKFEFVSGFGFRVSDLEDQLPVVLFGYAPGEGSTLFWRSLALIFVRAWERL